jgi:hypothetical protein
MMQRSRRQFLAEVGRGMVTVSVGCSLASELGLTPAQGGEALERLNFGPLEPLVALMQETPVQRLLPTLVSQLNSGTDLRRLAAAAALANARTFGGEDYVGFHTMMALAPAVHMSAELPASHAALPIFKVLYRNTNRIHEHGGASSEVLKVVPALSGEQKPQPQAVRDAIRRRDTGAAESTFAAVARVSAYEALNDLLVAVEDGTDVHRVVLPYRAWDMLGLIGMEHAHTLLRQSVRFCLQSEQYVHDRPGHTATVLATLLDQYHLMGREPGDRAVDDGWVAHRGKLLKALPTAPRKPPPPPWRMESRRPSSGRRSRWRPIRSSCATSGAPSAMKFPASPSAACMAIRSAYTRATRPMPGGTLPAPAMPATRSPA